MQHHEEFTTKLDDALSASEHLLETIKSGEWEKVQSFNNIRMELIRMLPMRQKSDLFWHNFGDKLRKIKELDQQILELTERTRSQLVSQIRQTELKKQGCVQYLQQQNIN